MNILFPEYKNHYYCQWHHSNSYLAKNGWWYGKEVWNGENSFYYGYMIGSGDELSEKYDENLIFKL